MLRPRPFRLVIVAVAAALVMWVAVGVTLTLTTGRSRPDSALVVWPWGATALAARAAHTVESAAANPAQRAAARADALRALSHEPGNVLALRTLGVAGAMDGRPAALAYLTAAERFTRRDVLVELALIEAAVARGDIETALTHYDRALRTGYRAYDLLFPVLVPASADPSIARPLGHRLAARPAWWNAFVERAIQDPAPNAMLGWLLRQVRLRAARPDERAFLVAGMQRLLAQGDVPGAQRLYRDARGPGAMDATIRDGGFERVDQLPPFEWDLTDNADMSAVREPAPTGGNRLRLSAPEGRSGVLARQQLTLAPGRYRIALSFGDATRGGFMLRAGCAGAAQPLASLPISGAGRRAAAFTVPVACREQALTVEAAGSPDAPEGDGTTPWIDDVIIKSTRP